MNYPNLELRDLLVSDYFIICFFRDFTNIYTVYPLWNYKEYKFILNKGIISNVLFVSILLSFVFGCEAVWV